MSRSRRHSPIMGNTTCASEKWFKRMCHGARRTFLRNNLAKIDETAEDIDVIDVNTKNGDWIGPKDGKQYFNPYDNNPEDIQAWMRK